MKKLLPFAFIFLIACKKETLHPHSGQDGIVSYTIAGETIQIADSASDSEAKWIYSTTVSEGYGMQAYYAKPGGEVSSMISLFVKTNKIEIGREYSNEVTGAIIKNSMQYVSTQDIEGTFINVRFIKQKDQTFSGEFTGRLKKLDTDNFFEISGTFDKVRLIQ